jgi:hypothetical protein
MMSTIKIANTYLEKMDKLNGLNTAFHRTVFGGYGADYAQLTALIEQGADVNSYSPSSVPFGDYRTALAQAIRVNNYGLSVFLIEMGANVNQITRGSGWFPLHCAVAAYSDSSISRKMIGMLLGYGADPLRRCPHSNETPIEMALRLKKNDVFDETNHLRGKTSGE